MDRNRLMMVVAVLTAVVVIAGGFFLGIAPQLSAASTAAAEQQTVTAQNQRLGTNLSALKEKFSKLDSLTSQLRQRRQTVPGEVASDSFITELTDIASASHVTVSNIAFGAPAAYAAPVSSTPAAASAPASASPSASSSPSATPTPTSTTPASPTVATSPLISAANFTDIPVTMQIKGTYTQATSFLQGLRDGKRLYLVTSISFAPTSSTSTSSTGAASVPTWTIGGLIYALTDPTTATPTQQSTAVSNAAGSPSSGSTTDSAAGK